MCKMTCSYIATEYIETIETGNQFTELVPESFRFVRCQFSVKFDP